jgi:hypothetical protein
MAARSAVYRAAHAYGCGFGRPQFVAKGHTARNTSDAAPRPEGRATRLGSWLAPALPQPPP